MKKIFFLLLLSLSTGTLLAQEYIFGLMQRNDLKISQIELLGKRHFDSVGTERGTGYNHFQRWLYEQKFHLDDNGYAIPPEREYENWKTTNASIPSRATLSTWTELGPWGWNRTTSWNPGTGRLFAIAVHPADTTVLYVGSPGGGLWKSVNSGTSWAPLTDNNATRMFIYSITIDQVNRNIVYAGTNGTVIKSADAGASWAATGSLSGTVRKILIDPTNSNLVFAASSGGIFRSTNAGVSWTQVHTGGKEDIEFKPDDPNIMYATGSDVYRSADRGLTWTVVGAGAGVTGTGRTLVAVTPAEPNRVYLVQASGSVFGKLYRSTDAGLSFVTTVTGSTAAGTAYFGYSTAGTDASGQATHDMALCVAPDNPDEVHIAGIICWKSLNGGTSFTATTAWSLPNGTGYNHADVHGLYWINNTIYSVSDGGIYKSMNRAEDWTDISTGLGIRQFYRIATSPTDPNVITGGAQDNGTVARRASGWVDWLGADGMEGLVSPVNPLNLWGTSQNGGIYRSTNGGSSYSGLSKPSNGQWVTPLASHPTDGATIYGGWTGFYRSTNSGSSFTLLSGSTITSALTDIAVAPSDPNYLYASLGSTLYVSTDGGATWATRTALSSITDICVSPLNPAKIWITCSSSSNRVFVSTDAGVSFTNLSLNLPAVAARSIVVENAPGEPLYVGMNTGVYYKTNTDAGWTNFTGNLPQVAVNELDIHSATGKIRVATYGRGVWEAPLVSGIGLPVRWLSFTAEKKRDGVQLNWRVAEETPGAYFEVERSRDGLRFEKIATLQSRGLAISDYQHFDNNPGSGLHYYRIKEVAMARDFFSRTIAVRTDRAAREIVLTPNPVSGNTLRFSLVNDGSKLFDITLYNAEGKMMMKQVSSDNVAELDISTLNRGMYVLVVKGEMQEYRVKWMRQ